MSSVPAENASLPSGMSAQSFSGLFQAVNGLRNTRALVAMIGCTVTGVLVAGLLMAMTGTLGALAGVLAFLVYFVAVGTGINAAGLLHMDHARGISPRSTVDALVYGLMCIPKLIVLGIALFLVELAVFIVIALMLVLCKIPFLGPLLFTVIFPVSVVLAGLTIFGLFLCLVLSLPAIWQGASIVRALSQTLAIARSRLVESLLLLVVVWLLSFAVGLVIFGVLAAGLMPTLGLSASIVGFGGIGSLALGGLAGMGGMTGLGGSGHAIAGAIGGAVLWAIAASLVLQVYLLGLCIVYLRVTDGLDLSATEAALRQKLDDARRRAGELGEKARSAAQRETAAPAGDSATAATPGTGHPANRAAAAAAGAMGAAATSMAPPAAPRSTPLTVPTAYAPPPSHAATAPAGGQGQPDIALDGPDIALPFDDLPPGQAQTMPGGQAAGYAAPPAYAAPSYAPPPYAAPPAQAPFASPAPAPTLPPVTTCPQCLSSVSADDLFCGVCGYRLK